jgi:hypothetical protein
LFLVLNNIDDLFLYQQFECRIFQQHIIQSVQQKVDNRIDLINIHPRFSINKVIYLDW